MTRLEVIYCPADGSPQIRMIEHSLETLQKLVGGYIETIRVAPGVVAIVNESGLLMDLPENTTLKGLSFVGNVILAGHDPGADDFRSLKTTDLWSLIENGYFRLQDLKRGEKNESD